MQKWQSRLKQFHNEPNEYIKALTETLEAEVRSKFQTAKQMEFSAKGQLVNVLFDETIVKYRWLETRAFEVVEIVLVSEDRDLVQELMKAQLMEGGDEEGTVEDSKEAENADETDVVPDKSIYDIDLSQYGQAPASAAV